LLKKDADVGMSVEDNEEEADDVDAVVIEAAVAGVPIGGKEARRVDDDEAEDNDGDDDCVDDVDDRDKNGDGANTNSRPLLLLLLLIDVDDVVDNDDDNEKIGADAAPNDRGGGNDGTIPLLRSIADVRADVVNNGCIKW
jgi:hypothetical protein